ncbi:DUF2125 domain-containing protein [Hoeflea sp.]|uniref:DUF2125 domain-containing protein n=1 Tax=Hoeflea sp. TaxID=1940281 RepID=UPI002B00272E|nr:DUF2125 domain-containing protein [Hoeflea sp.]
MPSTNPATRPSSRRFVWLGVAILAAIALWTIGWYTVAARIEAHLPVAMQQIAGTDASADCANAEIRGYPFRFGLFCDRLGYINPKEALALEAGALRSAAQFYRPGHVVSEIDGPLLISAPGLELQIDWQILQSSIRATTVGLDRGSIDSRNVSIDIDGTGLQQKLALAAERFTAHARKNGLDLDIAAYGEHVRGNIIADTGASTLALEATLPGRAGLLDMPYQPLLPPYEAQVHRLSVGFEGDVSLQITGPVRIAADGLVSGDLQISIRGQDQIAEIVARFNPEMGENVRRFGPMLAALDSVPGDDAITLPLTIRNGNLSMGMFPLGRLPAL